MFDGQKRFPRVLVLAAAVGGLGFAGLGCANFDAKDSPPLPATIAELRVAIEEQRALLLDFVSDTDVAGKPPDDDADRLVAIAKRLTQLGAALAELEQNAESTSP